MANRTHRDDFDRQLSEFAGQYNARSARNWLTTLPGGALARRACLRRPWSGERRSSFAPKPVASLFYTMNREIRAMEQVPAVLAVTTDVPGERRTLHHGRRLMHTAIADLGVALPSTDPVEDPAHAELERRQ